MPMQYFLSIQPAQEKGWRILVDVHHIATMVQTQTLAGCLSTQGPYNAAKAVGWQALEKLP
jgi:hypothetical protein